VMGPAAILTGSFSWWLNYGHKLTDHFRDKIAFSVIYMALVGIALALRTIYPEALIERETVGWFYAILVFAMVPIVSILGRVGTKILFPSTGS
jgi:hypothetical protein